MPVQLPNPLLEEAQAFTIPFEKTGFFGAVPRDFVAKDSKLLPFLEQFPSLASYRQKATDRSAQFEHRQVLVAAFKEQYQNMELSAAQQKNLEALSDNGVTVTTGHQLCFMGGPLYFIYKALHTIKLAQELNSSGVDVPVVPVFWLASEDHDFDEIAQLTVFGKKEALQDSENQIPVGKLPLHIFEPLKDFALSFFEGWESEAYIKSWLDDAWSQSNSLKDFTLRLLQHWFSPYGLLALDADVPSLKALFTSTVQKELETSFVSEAVHKTVSQFPDAYKQQAPPKACNFFLFEEGKRFRLDKEADHFSLHPTGKQFTPAEIQARLEQSPEDFSPNVLTRPLYQETILPNIAYIGGGGELAYWIQLTDAFKEAQIPMPQVVLRNSFQLVDAGVAKKLAKLDLEPKDIFLDEQLLINQHLAATEDVEVLDFAKAEDPKNAFFERIKKQVAEVDPTLVGSVEAQEKNVEKFLEGMQKKLKKRLKQKQETEINQIQSIKARLFPEGGLQERSENVIHYLAKHQQSFFDYLLEQSTGIDSSFKVIYLP